jgi:DNA-binding transcriptional LysR family regulator
LAVAQTTEEQFSQLSSRIKGQGGTVSGELVITSLVELSPLLAPVLADFQALHPQLVIRYLTGGRIFKLEYGEAHVAIRSMRAGSKSEHPDNVMQPFARMGMRLVAAPTYIARHGMPKNDTDMINHRFVGLVETESRAPFNQWLTDFIPAGNIVFRAEESAAMIDAIHAGAGIGFYPTNSNPSYPDMIEVTPQRPEWRSDLLLVTHVDLHRTTKVQAFLTFLKARAKMWPTD